MENITSAQVLYMYDRLVLLKIGGNNILLEFTLVIKLEKEETLPSTNEIEHDRQQVVQSTLCARLQLIEEKVKGDRSNI